MKSILIAALTPTPAVIRSSKEYCEPYQNDITLLYASES